MLEKCEETRLILNWKKCHFMVREGIVLRHKISHARLEVDPQRLMWLANYHHPQIAKPHSNLLCADQPYDFDEKCNQMFQTIKDALTSTSILITPDWSEPFQLMCDVSDVVGMSYIGSKEK